MAQRDVPLIRSGQSFQDEHVVRCYVHRPPYPASAYRRILALSPQRGALLDLGCGPGKIARELCRDYETIVAVDPSQAMLAVARSLPDGDASNISWLNSQAEVVDYDWPRFDVVVAAASIHWMDHPRLFARLRGAVRDRHVFIVMDGDGAFLPPWQQEWEAFLRKWIRIVKNEDFDPNRATAVMAHLQDWVEVDGVEDHDSAPFRQRAVDFIACQHSRDTFNPRRLGPRIDAFDRELEALLMPYMIDGRIEYRVRTQLAWGRMKG